MSELNNKLDEIALLAMMLHPNDPDTFDIVFGLLDEL